MRAVVPANTWYRRLVNAAKSVRILNHAFKQLNVGRKIEIRAIMHRAQFDPTDVICDVGCGDGYWSYRFSRQVGRVIGLDPFAADLAKARALAWDRLHVLRAVGERLPLPAASVDKVVSVCVFEHCYDDEQVFREIFRILRPGGRLVATVDSLSSPHVSESHRRWHRRVCYCRQLYTPELLARKLGAAGFQTVRTRFLMTSRLAIAWEIASERLGALISIAGPILWPALAILERRPRQEGYKVLVEAWK